MSTSFKNEFDKFDEDFNIDDITVIEDLGIDPINIKNNVLHQINTTVSKKRHKTLTVWLVAAAITTAVVGTSVIASTGVLHPDFTPMYKGDVDSLKVRGTDEFTFEPADPSLKAEFLGMVCTEEKIVASVALTKTDGTAFTDGDGLITPPSDSLDTYVVIDNDTSAEDYGNYIPRLKELHGSGNYPYVYYMQGKNKELYDTGINALDYVLSDDGKTIKLFISSSLLTKDRDEGYVTVTSEYTDVYYFNEPLCVFNTLNESTYYNAQSICKEKGLDIENDCRWKNQNGRYYLYDIKKEHLPLKYDMTYKVSYIEPEIISCVVDHNIAPSLIRPDRKANMTISASQFSISVKESFTSDEIREMQKKGYYKPEDLYSKDNNYLNYEDRISAFSVPLKNYFNSLSIDYNNSELIMTDGSVRYFITLMSGLDWQPENDNVIISEEAIFAYSDTFVENNMLAELSAESILGTNKTTIVDPQRIAKVILNNETIYTKPGYENVSIPDTSRTETSDENKNSDIDITETGKPDMSKYTPYEVSTEQLNALFKNRYDLLSMQVSTYNNVENDPYYVTNNIYVKYEGERPDLKNILYYLIGLEEKNIFIRSVTFSDENEDDISTINVELENPFATKESGIEQEEAAEYILYHWDNMDRKQLVDRFFTNEREIKTDHFSIKKESTTEKPMIKEPDIPDSKPVHKPKYKISIENYKYRKWTENELKTLAASVGADKETVRIANVSDDDNGSFSSKQMMMIIHGNKETVLTSVEKLISEEKNNLFINSVSIIYGGTEESELYDIELTIDNPFYNSAQEISEKETADYINSHYGSIMWKNALDACIELYHDNHDLSDATMYIQENDATKKPELTVNLHEEFSSYEAVVEYRAELAQNESFSLSEEYNIDKISSDDNIISYNAIITITSDKFLR